MGLNDTQSAERVHIGFFGMRNAGKSSVVKLLADALSANGIPAVPCGNYGTPVCEVADMDPAPAIAVAECSSFQLETADAALTALNGFDLGAYAVGEIAAGEDKVRIC